MAGEEGYAFSLTTFSPSGKLLQIEHALKAVQGGKASLGIQGAWPGPPSPHARAHTWCPEALLSLSPPHAACPRPVLAPGLHSRSTLHTTTTPAAKNGVVIATEKKLSSSLIDESAVEQIQLYTDSIGVVYSGMGPDSRVLVRMGQKKAAAYRLQYGVRWQGGKGGRASFSQAQRAGSAGA
jgi:20S proteasome subunit alpha 2